MLHRELREHFILACIGVIYLSEGDLMVCVSLFHLIIDEIGRCLRCLSMLGELYVDVCIEEIGLR